MPMQLESMAVVMPEVVGHPNRAAFRGVLTVVDAPSQKPPSGSRGHLVMLTRKAAEAALPSLLGMALDYAPSFDRHDVRRKVGMITSAELVGRQLELGGHLFARDFPEIVEEIAKSGRVSAGTPNFSPRDYSLRKFRPGPGLHGVVDPSWGQRNLTEGSRLRASLAEAVARIRSLSIAARPAMKTVRDVEGEEIHKAYRISADASTAGKLGMSYEVTDIQMTDTRAPVWMLTKVTFTGAAILRRDKAAYQDTWIEMCE